MNKNIEKVKRLSLILGCLQIFIAIGALPAGFILIADPSGQKLGMYLEMLSNSPFSNFLIPGLFLFIINGIANIIAGIISLKQYKLSYLSAIGLGTILIVWIIVQCYWIGFHWLQAFYLILGIVEVILGFKFRKHVKQ